MAVLRDEKSEFARIISRGWLMAQSQELSVSVLGPRGPPLQLQLQLEQQQQHMWGPDPASLQADQRGSGGSSTGHTCKVDSSPTCSAPLCRATSWTPTAAAARADSSAAHHLASTQTARRCLCAALNSHAAGDAFINPAQAISTEDLSCSTPTAALSTPAVRLCPGGPRAPPAVARTLLPLSSSTDGSNHHTTCGCAHFSPDGRSRLQQWLDRMELKLAVPPSPITPPAEVCPAPTAAGAFVNSSYGNNVNSSSSSSGALTSKKRALFALDALCLSTDKVHHNNNSSTCNNSKGVRASAASPVACTLGAGHSNKRRSIDGTTCAPMAVGGRCAGDGAAAGGLHDLPAPAFIVLGLLNGPQQLA